jgi:hypothetical protein
VYFTSAFNAKAEPKPKLSNICPNLASLISPAQECKSSITTVSASSTQSYKMSEVSEDMSAPTGQTPATVEPQLAEAKPPNTEVASDVASSAGAAATGVKDSVFSMFGGGGAKEKKAEEEDDAAKDEPSGSSKAAKDKEADDDVRPFGAGRRLLKSCYVRRVFAFTLLTF